MDRQGNLVDTLLERLTSAPPEHERFRGAPVDITGLTALELGRLWAAIHRARRDYTNPAAYEVAGAILRQAIALELVPALDEQACLDVYGGIAENDLDRAVDTLAYVICKPPDGFGRELRRILGEPAQWPSKRFQVFTLARYIDEATQQELRTRVREAFADDLYVLEEFDLLPTFSPTVLLAISSKRSLDYYWPGIEGRESDPAIALAGEPSYIEFSERALARARARINDIHNGVVPYEADGAFSIEDAQVIGRAARVAAHRDEPWFAEVIMDLLPKVCVAPTSAKTVPSQSLAIALGHAIEGQPTVEGVQALREALSVVRHAGVQKKLSRHLKPAERALAARPKMALRLIGESTPTKQQRALLATCLEAGWCEGLQFRWEDWCSRVGRAAPELVWSASGESRSFILANAKDLRSAIDCRGQSVELPSTGSVRLWHPLTADAEEREAWQSLIAARQIRQPLRQVYREYYRPAEDELSGNVSSIFAGHALAVRRLIGLARREGWLLDDHSLARRFGNVRVTFETSVSLYPGRDGWCRSGKLRFDVRRGSRWQQIVISELGPVLFSEACRAVDLLVSVSGFGLEDEPAHRGSGVDADVDRELRLYRLSDLPLTQIARMRQNVIRHALPAQVLAGQVMIDDPYVRVGAYAVHLATGRITRQGAPVNIPSSAQGPVLPATPWLPYDEVLLRKIVDSVWTLLHAAPSTPTG